MTEPTGWTVETALAHLSSQIRGLKDLFDERDKRYEERDRANKEAVKAALSSAEKALDATAAALKEYKAGSNEWRDTVKDLVNDMPSRVEVTREFQVLDGKIQELRESRSILAGQRFGRRELTTDQYEKWGYIVGVAGLAVALLAVFYK